MDLDQFLINLKRPTSDKSSLLKLKTPRYSRGVFLDNQLLYSVQNNDAS